VSIGGDGKRFISRVVQEVAMPDVQDFNSVKVLRSTATRLGVPRLRLALLFAVSGALSFWLPEILIHLDAGPSLDSRHEWAITMVAPATFLVSYVTALKLARRRDFNWPGAAMLLGVWLGGGLFMTLSAMATGAEFMGATGIWRLVVILLSVVPIVTYILAAYDGSFFALLAVTLGGLIFWGVRTGWILWNTGSSVQNKLSRSVEPEKSKAA
jgi:hypothetical protein